jgi:hypothetical protein
MTSRIRRRETKHAGLATDESFQLPTVNENRVKIRCGRRTVEGRRLPVARYFFFLDAAFAFNSANFLPLLSAFSGSIVAFSSPPQPAQAAAPRPKNDV